MVPGPTVPGPRGSRTKSWLPAWLVDIVRGAIGVDPRFMQIRRFTIAVDGYENLGHYQRRFRCPVQPHRIDRPRA